MLSRISTYRWQVIAMALVFFMAGASVRASEGVKDELHAVLSIDADTEYGSYLAGECLTCHVSGTAGGKSDSVIPVIHGKAHEIIVQALLEYRADIRDNQIMRSVAKNLSDDEIAALSAWFAEQE